LWGVREARGVGVRWEWEGRELYEMDLTLWDMDGRIHFMHSKAFMGWFGREANDGIITPVGIQQSHNQKDDFEAGIK